METVDVILIDAHGALMIHTETLLFGLPHTIILLRAAARTILGGP